MRHTIIAAALLLAACGDSGDGAEADDAGLQVTLNVGEDAIAEDLFIECNLPMGGEDEEFAMTETRSFIAYEGRLHNYNEMDSAIADNCSPARDGCRDDIEDGTIVSQRTPFSGEDQRVRILRVDTETLDSSLVVVDGDSETPLDDTVTCERLPYPDQVNPPSLF